MFLQNELDGQHPASSACKFCPDPVSYANQAYINCVNAVSMTSRFGGLPASPPRLIYRGRLKWLVRGLVKFVTAVARLVCPNLLG